ncbi:hypothetical protein SERLA73DRAFT_175920 [Serpula lacrymans var. lacrymans S7.3]|uniref:DUF6699 domain-containing protein n=2 Tax=Serpula lacrymans var. lacrymans TaxID=341189 RepID=F8PK00_SERL3|nr:uncharacterized protein SERLADRAFT_458577 [Serpula lacrymans var. lacrymans S7.9]EGO04137.1 hypothetical protein SERLA73DRAFT_175920 [Serpula lacrymans var. lacrymans S7.3]EGO30069.1 hypothetical protein SERLADRAFT_458577 [Serpula lacrymans var. lacrymans S7.9]
MSSPYVYSPPAYEPTPYLYSYHNQPQRSPFIPPATLFPSSPHTPSSPYIGLPNTPQGVHFDDGYWQPPPRVRRPSWHAGTEQAPPSPSFLSIPQQPNHNRRHSFGHHYTPWTGAPPGSPWSHRPSSPHFQIHPLLNGEAPRSDFYFDLASPSFTPMRWISPGQSVVVSWEELRQPATYPSITSMRITHPAIPKWPIDLEYHYDNSGSSYTATAPLPITLADVLQAIHYALHKQISHRDWAELTLSEETAIARAYTRRCRSVPSSAQVEASQGVKRVDYLKDKFMFRGLVRAQDEDGFYHWKMIT